jgi:DNA-directed RNA polymerase specialized sigma24 family protein
VLFSDSQNNPSPLFQTTHWSVVLQAASGDSAAALERLCRAYWYPLYAFVRRLGHASHDAQDLTQGFFELFLARHFLKDVDHAKGRFRSFLLVSLKHYLANEWKKAGRQKRGGGLPAISFDAVAAEERYRMEPEEASSAEKVYDRRWARQVLNSVMDKLHAEFHRTGKGERFEALSLFLFEEPGPGAYARLAEEWKVTGSGLRSSVQRIRQRYAALFRAEIAGTVQDPREVDSEIAYLLSALND